MKKIFFKIKKDLDVAELFDRDALAFAGDNNFVNSQAEEAVRVKIARDYKLNSNPSDTVVLFQDKTVFNDFNAQDLIDLQVKYWKQGQEKIEQYKKSQIFYDYVCVEVSNKKEEKKIKKEIEQREDFVGWATYPEEQYDPTRQYYRISKDYYINEMVVNPSLFTDDMFENKQLLLSFKNTPENHEKYKGIIEKYNLEMVKDMSGILVLDKSSTDGLDIHEIRKTADYVADKKKMTAEHIEGERINKENVAKAKKAQQLKDAKNKQTVLHNMQFLLTTPVDEQTCEHYNELFDEQILRPIKEWLNVLPEKQQDAGIGALLSHFESSIPQVNVAVDDKNMKFLVNALEKQL